MFLTLLAACPPKPRSSLPSPGTSCAPATPARNGCSEGARAQRRWPACSAMGRWAWASLCVCVCVCVWFLKLFVQKRLGCFGTKPGQEQQLANACYGCCDGRDKYQSSHPKEDVAVNPRDQSRLIRGVHWGSLKGSLHGPLIWFLTSFKGFWGIQGVETGSPFKGY